RSEDQRSDALSAALKLSKGVLDNPGEASTRTRLRALNDLVYYGWEDREKFGRKTVDDERFAKLVDELRASIGGQTRRYEYLDTLQRASKYLKKLGEMRSYALQVRDSLEQS